MTHSATVPHHYLPDPPGSPSHPRPAPQVPRGGLPRLLPVQGVFPVDLAAHRALHGPLPYRGAPRRLIGEVEAAGLTGRGGAAFPTYRKLAAVSGYGPAPVVVGNGAEGEPASNKDKSLLWLSPHLVMDGLQLAAEAVGSRAVGLYVHRNPRLHGRLRSAIAERDRAGVDACRIELVEAPPRFLAGEESALASLTSGGAALPRYKPPRASARGVAGQPTLVQNVETLAHLALIARYGAAWFRTAGTEEEPGSMLATLHLADGRVDVVEVPLGIGLAGLLGLRWPAGRDGGADSGRLSSAGGAVDSPGGPVQAVLIGGYHGAWLPATSAVDLPLDNAALRPRGAAVGAGVIAALPAGRCGLAETARVARYLALESAGQCGPCFNGLPRIAVALGQLAGPRPGRQVLADLHRWAGLVEGRGACHHPDGTTRFVRSALRVFTAEIERHEQGWCAGRGAPAFLPLPGDPPLDDADWR
jgi:NADH:ubiquinone oxidoreductase subunit F (NADH-binding)